MSESPELPQIVVYDIRIARESRAALISELKGIPEVRDALYLPNGGGSEARVPPELCIWLVPTAIGAGAYVSKKLVDVVADILKKYILDRYSKETIEVKIYDGEGYVVRTIKRDSDQRL